MPFSFDNSCPPSADVVLVGSGLSALTSAVALARQGLDVSVFEKEPVAGDMLRI
jgi:phytoene dehydrogenase-like protein